MRCSVGLVYWGGTAFPGGATPLHIGNNSPVSNVMLLWPAGALGLKALIRSVT
jgi:hypothetical protein